MKKREITKIVHSLMVAGLAACLLAGCGNAKTESSSDTAVEETTDAEAATESEAAENEAAEEQSDANAEALAEDQPKQQIRIQPIHPTKRKRQSPIPRQKLPIQHLIRAK